jgi:hypothetical protein
LIGRRTILHFAGALLAGGILTLTTERPSVAVMGGGDASALSVPAILRKRESVCSGALIAPRVVLSAAHCFVGGSDSAMNSVTFDSPLGTQPRAIAIRGMSILPDFDPITLANDVALILLAEDAPRAPMPWGLAHSTVGSVFGIAGYGSHEHRQPDLSRTVGTARLAEWVGRQGRFDPAPSQACRGDSGGPILDDSVVVGVISSGNATCMAGHSAFMLDESTATFISAFVEHSALRSASRGIHAPCSVPWDCGQGVCARAGRDPPRCLRACTGSDLACNAHEQCAEVSPLAFMGSVKKACVARPWSVLSAVGQPNSPFRWALLAAAVALAAAAVMRAVRR